MEKKEYIVNQLSRTFKKKYENYCITRIIHKIDDVNIEFVTQQMFKRPNGKIAYADLYFPQLNISVEIDEPNHLKQKEADEERTLDIIKTDQEKRKKYEVFENIIINPIEVHRIEITETSTLAEINKKTDDIVDIIRNKIFLLRDTYIPWETVYKPPSYYIEKGFIDITDNAKFRINDDIGKLFNIQKIPMNYNIHNYVPIIPDLEYFWCPKIKMSEDDPSETNAINTLSEDGNYVFEYFQKDNDKEVKKVLNDHSKRFVFAEYKDDTGIKVKKFIGVFSLDAEKTVKENVRSWRKVSNRIELEKYF